MSHQERASLIAILTSLVVNTFVIVRMWQLRGAGAFAGEDAIAVWATVLAWAFPAAIGATILFNVLFKLAERGRGEPRIMDERDRRFQVRGLSVTFGAVVVGYMTMIFGLAFGWQAIVGLSVLYASLAIGDILGNAVRFASYRIGC